MFIAQKADSFIVDGIGDEPFWDKCEWYNMDYIWIPYGEALSIGDFKGRIKFAWTAEKRKFYWSGGYVSRTQ